MCNVHKLFYHHLLWNSKSIQLGNLLETFQSPANTIIKDSVCIMITLSEFLCLDVGGKNYRCVGGACISFDIIVFISNSFFLIRFFHPHRLSVMSPIHCYVLYKSVLSWCYVILPGVPSTVMSYLNLFYLLWMMCIYLYLPHL